MEATCAFSASSGRKKDLRKKGRTASVLGVPLLLTLVVALGYIAAGMWPSSVAVKLRGLATQRSARRHALAALATLASKRNGGREARAAAPPTEHEAVGATNASTSVAALPPSPHTDTAASAPAGRSLTSATLEVPAGADGDAPNSESTLIAVTTCNHPHLLRRFLAHAPRAPYLRYLVISDAGTDGSEETARAHGVRFTRHAQASGLSAGWDLAYAAFRDEGYRHLVISNDDVVIPTGALEALRDALDAHGHEFEVLGPMTHPAGLGDGGETVFYQQRLGVQHPGIPEALTAQTLGVEQAQAAQDAIGAYLTVKGRLDSHPLAVPAPRYTLGFFLGFSRSIIAAKARNDPRFVLLEPRLRNLSGEEYLLSEVKARFGIATRVYVHHDKGATLASTLKDRDNLVHCHHDDAPAAELEAPAPDMPAAPAA